MVILFLITVFILIIIFVCGAIFGIKTQEDCGENGALFFLLIAVMFGFIFMIGIIPSYTEDVFEENIQNISRDLTNGKISSKIEETKVNGEVIKCDTVYFYKK